LHSKLAFVRRIGIIGTENSHVDQFVRLLNRERRHPGTEVAALVGGATERNRALCEAAGIDLVVDGPGDLIGRVDAAIVSSRDGRLHREQAEPLLAAGMPVLVDKPLAASVPDARAILDAAERGGAPLVAGSSLRYLPEVARIAAARQDHGEPRHLTVTGPADPDSEYSGLFFYGIHHVEIALQILGDPPVEPGTPAVSAIRHGDTTVALTRLGDVVLTLAFITPGSGTRVPFHVTLTGTSGVCAGTLVPGTDYLAPLLARFVEACDRGRAPDGPQALLSPIAVLESVTRALPGARGRN
jgi:predicted dehydrogenase